MYNKVELCGVNTGQLPVLTEAEKRQLLTLAHAGDKAARARMVEGNLRLVLSVVQRFAQRGENLDDLVQVGCIGLIKAIGISQRKASAAQLWRTTYDVNGFGNRKVCPIRFSRALCRAKLRLYLTWSGFPGGRIGNKYDDPVARCRSAYFRINCNILLVISNRIIRPVLRR